MNRINQLLCLLNEKLSFDLDKEFDWVNSNLFGGLIEKPDILKYSKLKNVLGLTHSKRIDGKLTTPKLEISSYYNLTIKQLRSVLAHECIHVYQNMKNLPTVDGGHDKFFFKMMDVINTNIDKYNLKDEIEYIKKSENPDEINTFEDDMLKNKEVLVVIHDPKYKLVALIKYDVFMLNKDRIIRLLKSNFNKDVKIEYLKTDNSICKKYKLLSKLNKFDVEKISDKDYDIIKKDSEPINMELELDITNLPKLKKSLGVLLIESPKLKHYVFIFPMDLMTKPLINKYIDLISYNYKKDFRLVFLESDSPILASYKVNKGNSNKPIPDLKPQQITEKEFNDINDTRISLIKAIVL